MAKEYKVITLKNGEKRYQFDVSLGYDASGNRMRTTIRTKDRAKCSLIKTGVNRSNTYKKGAISSHLFFIFVEFLIRQVLKSI